MSLPPIIGLAGVARAGKDTVGHILHDLYGYEVMSFSDVLNKALIALNPWVPFSIMDFGRVAPGMRYADLVSSSGYESAKEEPEVRRLLQAMGTEVGRNLLGEDIWVEAMFRNMPKGKLVTIVNVRFPNEFDAVKNRGGQVWRVHREGYAPALGHISDTALEDFTFDWEVGNDSSIPALADKIIDHLYDAPVQFAHNEGIRAGS